MARNHFDKNIFTAVICGSLLSAVASCALFLGLKNMPVLACMLSVFISACIAFSIILIISKKNTHNITDSAEDIPQNDVISVIAHEVRSPITSVKGYLNALNDGVIPPEQQRKYIDIAISESDRAIKLLENLMSLTKFDSGSIKLNKECFDINELIRIVIIDKLNDIEAKNISVETDFAQERMFVTADKGFIKQVICNLTDNAIKYNTEGGKIKFATSQASQKTVISISDTGIGISKEALPHIWDRFYQADSSSGESYKGHGLGLCIVKEIIKAHGQTISVNSAANVGTSFTFTLESDNNAPA